MKQRKLNFLAALALLAGIIIQACNTAPDSKKTAEDSNKVKFDKSDSSNPSMRTLEKDADFAVTAADGGLLEVQLGQLAQNNAGAQKVRDFGLMMVQDHSKANNELKALAAQKNISLPDSLSKDKKMKYDELRSLTGARFDKKYMSLMVSDHKEVIDEFHKYVNTGADRDLVQWATAKLPTLELHLQHARQEDSLLKK